VQVLPEEARRKPPILLRLVRAPSIAVISCILVPSTDTAVDCSQCTASCSRTVADCTSLVNSFSIDLGCNPAVTFDKLARLVPVHLRHRSRKSQVSWKVEPFYSQ
jgi:hypothetical protein